MKSWLEKWRAKQPSSVDDNGKYHSLSPQILSAYNKVRPQGAQPYFCYVPFTNITFSFRGKVLACAYNQKVVLGHYPKSSVEEMWFNSAEGTKLREHLQHNDLNYGCKHCKYFAEHHKFSGLKPLVFDHYAGERHDYPKVLEFELSNVCNFECVMCNGEVSSSVRKNRDKLPSIKSPYDEAFVEQLRPFIPHIEEAKFYGGEPFYQPLYYKIWELILEIKPSVKIFVITNGSILNDEVKSLLQRGNFQLGVSMDSVEAHINEHIRLNVHQPTLLQNIAYFNQYMQSKRGHLNISFTLMRINYSSMAGVINFCNQHQALLYVSYLKGPSKFALWNLPSEDLSNIIHEVSQWKFPEKTVVEKHNFQCWKDFLTWLKATEKENLHRNPTELKAFDPNFMPGVSPLAEAYQSDKDYKAPLFSWLENHSFDAEFIIQKIETASFKIHENADVNRVYYSILNGETLDTVQSIQQMDELILHQSVKALLFSKS